MYKIRFNNMYKMMSLVFRFRKSKKNLSKSRITHAFHLKSFTHPVAVAKFVKIHGNPFQFNNSSMLNNLNFIQLI